MKHLKKWSALLLLLLLAGGVEARRQPTSKEVLKTTKLVADWQIKTFENQGDYRALTEKKAQDPKAREKYFDLRWMPATFYAGLYQLYTITEEAKYLDWLTQMGERHEWQLNTRVYHADDHAVGQFYLNLYELEASDKIINPTKERFDEIMTSDKADENHWWWCDALFMAPPVWTRLAKVSGEMKYLEYMDSQYHKTYDLLWSPKDDLFFRDKKYLTRHEENGESLFWGRGNGWVFGGLTLLIQDLPKGWEGSEFYITLFKEMAKRLKQIQRPDGTWSAGLLGDLSDYPVIETSGSSFFTFGLAWGIRAGLLDRNEYEQTLFKAWEGLTKAVRKDGMLGYVQPVGAAPGASSKDGSELYGTGAFVAAGAEMYRYLEVFYPKK
ncbi:MAG: glycoside hydrolase family 88 protein [Rikenellaceae bacterium]